MEESKLYTTRMQVVEAREQGVPWHEAAKRAGLQISDTPLGLQAPRLLAATGGTFPSCRGELHERGGHTSCSWGVPCPQLREGPRIPLDTFS